LRDVERQQILAALEQTGWHRGKTAEILGISPSTLYRRLRDYNLENRSG
jgi:DNA-binding NtrC family response regulator